MTKKKKYVFLIMVGVFFTLIMFNSFAVAMASVDKSEALPTPISFGDSGSIVQNSILLKSVAFDLSDANPTQAYLISEGYEDLIFLFKGVSAPINFSLKTQNEDSHCAGFSGGTCKVNIKIDPNSEYEFEWSRGFYIDFEASVQENVNYSSGLLEIYQVID